MHEGTKPGEGFRGLRGTFDYRKERKIIFTRTFAKNRFPRLGRFNERPFFVAVFRFSDAVGVDFGNGFVGGWKSIGRAAESTLITINNNLSLGEIDSFHN